MPEVRIMKQPVLQLNKETEVILTLFNPLDTMTHVTMLPSDKEDDPWDNAKVSFMLISVKLLNQPIKRKLLLESTGAKNP